MSLIVSSDLPFEGESKLCSSGSYKKNICFFVEDIRKQQLADFY